VRPFRLCRESISGIVGIVLQSAGAVVRPARGHHPPHPAILIATSVSIAAKQIGMNRRDTVYV
jgi:hypothetical protein